MFKIFSVIILISLSSISGRNFIFKRRLQSFPSSQASVDCNPLASNVQTCFTQCILLYKGSRNYFNQNTGQCEPTAQCTSLQTYNISNNSCSPLINQNSNYPQLNNTNSQRPNNQIVIIVCINGNLIANSTCVCNQGFTDGPQDQSKPNIVVKCAQLIGNSTSNGQVNNQGNYSNYYPYPVPSNSTLNSVNSGSLSMINQIIIIVTCLVVAGYTCCGLIYYCKYRMKAKRSQENFSIQQQPFPMFNSTFSQNNPLGANNLQKTFSHNNFAVNKPDLTQTYNFDSKIVNSYKDASFHKRYKDYHRGRNVNTSSFYDSPVKDLRRGKKISKSEIRSKRTKRVFCDSDEEM